MHPTTTSFPGNNREHFESRLTLRIGAVQETCGEIWNGAPEMCPGREMWPGSRGSIRGALSSDVVSSE